MIQSFEESDDHLLDRFQRGAFAYFEENYNVETGLVADTSRPGSPSSIAVVGIALSCYIVAVERRWFSREEAADRVFAALRFFRNSAQGEQGDATGYKGFYYHFLDMESGKRVWNCEVSLIDTSLLLAGILAVRTYFDGTSADDIEIRDHADELYRRVNWQWARGGEATVRQGWKPEGGFLHYGWDGYDEAIILYVLGLASPTHALPDDSYPTWTETYQWENLYDIEFLYAGPLFIHHYSHAWIDFSGIHDRFMRQKNIDYFENSRRATMVQREYARRNPHDFSGYGKDCWGISASDGPGSEARNDGRDRRFLGYAARGAPYGPDDGTINPCAALASVPFAPAYALAALRHICSRYPQIVVNSRLPSGFNPTLLGAKPAGWVSEGYFGLDQGMIVLMIENFRSGLIWKLMRRCPYIETGLRRAGFSGGWLL